jgi:NAD(P)-dependent dehydrogenase (short-subunit alcohol dehydrogenase family)
VSAGRTAIVTGASRGIGLAVAERLVREGANVVLTARTLEAAQAAADTLGDRAVGFGAHAADEEAAHACVAFALERFGQLDVLVNNAGTNPAAGPVTTIERSRFMKTIEVNLWAPLLWTGVAERAWMGEHGGAVVNVASVGGLIAGPDTGIYRVSKAALIHLTKQLAFELAPKMRVNAVAPGLVRTKLAEGLWASDEERVAAGIPLQRIGEPPDVADAVAFLARAEWMTGETLVVDGGQLVGAAASRARLSDGARA